MITPGDIPASLAELAESEVKANVGHWVNATTHEVAASVLNAAIKEEIVFSASFVRKALEIAYEVEKTRTVDEFASNCMIFARLENEWDQINPKPL